ncbi:transposase [Escherichia coli]|nr:transposase [Escherichia coli]
MTDFGGKTSIFSHPVYLFLREFSLQDFRGGSQVGFGNNATAHQY